MRTNFRQRLARPEIFAAAITLTLLSNAAFAADPVCPTCFAQKPAVAPVAADANSLGLNVSTVFQASGWATPAPSAVQYATMAAGPVANWNGTGDLPGAFQRPWELAPSTNFDPSFRTSFWTPETGPIETPFAPWNWSQQLTMMGPPAPNTPGAWLL